MPAILVVATVVQFWAGSGHLPRRVGGRQAPLDEHEHAGRARHRRRLRLQHLRHPLAGARRAVGAAAARVLRDLAGHPRAGPGRPVDGGAGQEAHRRRRSPPSSAWPRRPPGCCATAPRSTSRSSRSSSATWSGSGPVRRSRSTASSSTASTAVDESMLTGESLPVGQDHRRRRHRRHPQPHRHARARGPPRSATDTALAQIVAPRRGRAGRQGADAAPRRPGLGVVRARSCSLWPRRTFVAWALFGPDDRRTDAWRSPPPSRC